MKSTGQEQRGGKMITVIVGSSLARNLSIRNVENHENEVRLWYQSGNDCSSALSWLQSPDGRSLMQGANQIIFILGTNDLHRVGAFQTVHRIAHAVSTVRRLYPGIRIIWQQLQQRTRKTWLLPEGLAVLREIERCNELLLEVAARDMFDTIQPNIPIEQMYDGLHPTSNGVRMMETTIRDCLRNSRLSHSVVFAVSRSDSFVVMPPPLMSIRFD